MKMEILLEPTLNKLLVVGFNPLVHSFCALSTLRRSGLRTASAAAKPCQGDSLEFYLITGSIYTDKRGTVVLATLFNESEQRHFRVFITNIYLQESRRFRYSDACYHDPEKCEHAGPKLTHKEGNTGTVELSKSRVKCCMTNVVNNKTNDNESTSKKLVSEDIMNDEGNTETVEEGVDSLVNDVTPPKWAAVEYDVPGALLHNTIAQVMRERPLSVV
ncbi:hypothetical protein Tco_1375531 [Tanacetum coccineum]